MAAMTTLTAVPDADKAARKGSSYDCVLLVGHDLAAVKLAAVQSELKSAKALDAGFAGRTTLWPAEGAAGGRLVLAPTGPIARDYDDVRRYAEAAAKGARLARDAGAKKILLVVQAPPGANSSCCVHPSRVNLYSIVPAGRLSVASQMPSPLLSSSSGVPVWSQSSSAVGKPSPSSLLSR